MILEPIASSKRVCINEITFIISVYVLDPITVAKRNNWETSSQRLFPKHDEVIIGTARATVDKSFLFSKLIE